MDTKSVEKKVWLYIAAASLFISVASLFTTIFVYNNKAWTYKFNILGLIRGKDFVNNVLASYTGKVYWKIDATWVTLLAIISVASLVCAVVGLVTLRQYESYAILANDYWTYWHVSSCAIGPCCSTRVSERVSRKTEIWDLSDSCANRHADQCTCGVHI